VAPERGGSPFWQIFLSRNGAPVNIVYHSRNADTAAFRSSDPANQLVPYAQNLANWLSGKSLKLLPPDTDVRF